MKAGGVGNLGLFPLFGGSFLVWDCKIGLKRVARTCLCIYIYEIQSAHTVAASPGSSLC